MPSFGESLAVRGLSSGLANTGRSRVAGALMKARLRAGRAIWLMQGDSLVDGWGSNGAGGAAGTTPGTPPDIRHDRSPATAIADMLNTMGIPARADNFIGTGGTTASNITEALAKNPTLTAGAGWTLAASGIGGRVFFNSSDTTEIIYTPAVAADSFDIIVQNSNATFTVVDPSGTLATVNAANLPNKGGQCNVVRVTRPVSSRDPIRLARSTSGLYLVGILPFDSKAPMFEIVNAGVGGTTTAQWTDTAANVGLGLLGSVLKPDFITHATGVNDKNQGRTPAQYQADLMTVITNAKNAGADIIVAKPSSAVAGSNFNFDTSWLAAVDAAAAAGSLPTPINLYGTPLETADRYDGVHLAYSGSQKLAQTYISAIMALA